MFWDKTDKKYFANIKKKSIIRKTKYWRKNLHINHDNTNIKIIKIKNDIDWANNVIALKTWNEYECFYWSHKKTINTFLLKQKYDMVGTNIKGKVIDIKEKVEPNKILFFNKDVRNIWIFKGDSIDYFGIKKDIILDTK